MTPGGLSSHLELDEVVRIHCLLGPNRDGRSLPRQVGALQSLCECLAVRPHDVTKRALRMAQTCLPRI